MVQPPPPPPPQQLAVQVSVSGFGPFVGIDGFYLAGELDEDGKPHIFTKGGDVFPKWRIVNSGICGWTVEADYEGEGWQSIGVTYKDWYKEDCTACTGPCRTDEALTTDEVYDVDNGNLLPGEVSLALGYYDGDYFDDFVAA